METSARSFSGASSSRSARIAASTEPPSASGWRRRVSLKRLISTCSLASRNSSRNGDAAALEVLEHLDEALEVAAAARVGGHGRVLDLAALVAEQVGQRADHLGRQVVDAEVAGVLEGRHRLRLAGAR